MSATLSNDCSVLADAFPTLPLRSNNSATCCTNLLAEGVSALEAFSQTVKFPIIENDRRVFCRNDRIVGISLYSFRFNSTIPSTLANLTELELLDLTDCRLRGTIPAALSTLKNLVVLNLGFNTITGPLPREIGNFSRLEILGLDNNHLNGSLPYELGNLKNLTKL
ncbi:hypothetical protein HDU96_010699, partial [Phlyctochytrium bullatum]